MPAKLHTQYLQEMYLHNRLRAPGGMTIADVPIDINNITVPTYCLATQQDHIAPWQSVFAGMQLFQSDVRFVLSEAGHIAGVVNPPQHSHYGFYQNPNQHQQADDWFATAEFQQGSWWQDWLAWLENHSGAWVHARFPSTVIEDAPGSYVKVRIDQ